MVPWFPSVWLRAQRRLGGGKGSSHSQHPRRSKGNAREGKSHWKQNSSFKMLEAWMSPCSLLKAGKGTFRCYIPVAPKPSPNFAEICQQDEKSQSSCITFFKQVMVKNIFSSFALLFPSPFQQFSTFHRWELWPYHRNQPVSFPS